jgi:hypothetical protein
MTGGGGRLSRVILGKPKKGADVAGIGARSGKQGSWRGFEGSFSKDYLAVNVYGAIG